jgi:hypothetical protein
MGLKGYMDIEIETDNTIENIRIAGSEFSWEEGGDHSASFLFVYFDSEQRFEIFVEFSTANHQMYNWNVSVNSTQVTIINEELAVSTNLLNYDIDDF